MPNARAALWCILVAGTVLSADLRASTTIFNSLTYDGVTNPSSLCTVTNTCSDLFGYQVLSSASSIKFTSDSIQGHIGLGASTPLTTAAGAGKYVDIGGPIDYSDTGATKSVVVYTDSTHTSTTSITVPSAWSTVARTEIDNGPYVNFDPTTISSATSEYQAISNYWAAQTTYTVHHLNVSGQASTKFGRSGGVTSIDITGQGIVYYTFDTNVSANLTVTITGGADDMIVFEVPSTVTVTLNAAINLAGGMSADNVLWNVTNPSTASTVLTINTGGNPVWGDFIVSGTYKVASSMVVGRVYGGAGAVLWNADGDQFNAPEPPAWSLLALGLAAFLRARCAVS